MSTLIDRLRAAGADMDGAMDRMLDDAELYQTCFAMFVDDGAFPALDAALLRQDYTAAFEAAHTLKGVAANLGLTDMVNALGAVSDAIRHGPPASVSKLNQMYQAVQSAQRDLQALLM